MDEEKDGFKVTGISGVGNYYGGLSVAEKDGEYFWYIMDYDGDYDFTEKIPKYLFDAFIQYEQEKRLEND